MTNTPPADRMMFAEGWAARPGEPLTSAASRGRTLKAECAIVAAAAAVAEKHSDPGMADSLNEFAGRLMDSARLLLGESQEGESDG